MPRTVVALYDRLEDARDAVDALIENGYTHEVISLMAADTYGEYGIPRDQAEPYHDGIRSGGTLVAVQASDDIVDETIAILNLFNPSDMERRADARRLGQEGGLDETHSFAGQPMNLEAESEVPPEDARQDAGADLRRETGKNAEARSGLHRIDEGGAVIGRGTPGQTSYPPDEHDGTISMQDADRESRRAERRETPESGQAAGYNLRETDAGGTSGPEGSAGLDQTTGFDAFEPLYRQHYSTSYSHVGRSYEELRPAYAFGYSLARDPRFHDRGWEDVETNARSEWELSHTDQPWEEFKEAVREAWEAVLGWD